MNAPTRTLEDFMGQALALENDAVDRYTMLADAMEVHNNHDVATMFRKMAGYEAEHAKQIMAQMGWTAPPPPPPGGYTWTEFESPEAVPADEIHYLMQPWHALQLALAAEQRAEKFFGALAAATTDEAVRKAALEMQIEEREHVDLVLDWLNKVPPPDKDWAVDPDPPRYTD